MTTSATPVIPGVGVKVPKPARCGHRLNNVKAVKCIQLSLVCRSTKRCFLHNQNQRRMLASFLFEKMGEAQPQVW